MVPEAIVIDNGSDQDKKPVAICQVLELERNYGFTAGWNKAIEHFYDKYDAFWLMNSDIIISRESVARIKDIIQQPHINIITASFNCWMQHCRYQNTHGTREVKVIEFTAPVIKKNVFEKIGMFDERFIRGWGVEFDFCYRAKKDSFKIYVDDNSNFYHIGQQSISMNPEGPDYFTRANTEWYTGMSAKYGKNWLKDLYGDKNYINYLKNL
jgi:GT2 family glycosyltransferase